MDKPKISVIVPVYKVEKYLVQCLESIVNQTLKDIEIIPVDEGDPDACRYIIDHYEQTDSRVKAIHERNGGYGASCNKGFDIARGEYISIIESDDFIEPDMYEKMYTYAKKLDADVVKTPYYEYWDKTADENEIIKPCFWHDWVKDVPENKLFSIEEYPVFMGIHPSIWAALYKTSYIKEKNIRCVEARGAGYVDNHFRTLTLSLTNRLAWFNKSFNYYRLSNEGSSWVNYNISNFIVRWNDVHKFYQTQPSELYKAVVAYSIAEEYINTVERLLFGTSFLTEKDADLLFENLSYTTFEQIKNAKIISAEGKEFMCKIKRNKKELNRYIKKHEKKFFACSVKIHLNHSTIHLFKFLKHNIFRCIIRFGGLYMIDFCIGKVK